MRRLGGLLLAAVLGTAACDGFGPSWTVDLFVPIRYPDVQLADFAVGGQIPPADLPFTTPVETQDVEGLVDQVLSEDIVAIVAEVLFATQANVSGNIEMSVAPNPADLFSANPQLAVTVPITIAVTAGDTTTVNVAPDLFQSGSGEAVPTLYFQTRGTLRGAAGGTAVGPADVLSLGVNLILTVTVNDTTP